MKIHTEAGRIGVRSGRALTVTLYAIELLTVFLVSSYQSPRLVIHGAGRVELVSPLHIDGRYIEDVLGNRIHLRGVNQEGFLDSSNGWWNPQGGNYLSGLNSWDPQAVKYNLDGMRDWGCNVLRLHTKVQWWLDNTNNYRQHLKDTARWAAERGIYIVFEPYCIVQRSGDYLPFPPYGLTPEEESYIPSAQAFVEYWRGVAEELKNCTNVVFELFNEPFYADAESVWFDASQQCINAIRAAGSENIIIVQWGYCSLRILNWIQDYPLNGINIAYSTHIYRWHGSFNGSYLSPPDYDYVRGAMDEIRQTAEILNKTVVIGEIGANMYWGDPTYPPEDLQNELACFNNTLTILNEWKIGYIAWVWTVTAHMAFGLLQNDVWLPQPNEAGQILISNMKH